MVEETKTEQVQETPEPVKEQVDETSETEVAVETPKTEDEPAQKENTDSEEAVKTQAVEDDNKKVVTNDEVDQLNAEVEAKEKKQEEQTYVPRSEFEKLQREFIEKQKAWDEKVKAMEANLNERFVAKGQRKSYAPTQPRPPVATETVAEKEPVKPEDEFKDLTNEEKFELFEKFASGRR